MSNKAVLYARVSSKEQEREGFSIPAQIELLEKYAMKNNFKIAQQFIDIETAKKSGRTNFNKMLSYLRKHKDIKTILVEKTDRLYRNLPDYVTIDDSNLDLHFVKEGVILNKDSHSSEKFMHLIKVGMAKQYIDNLSEEVKKGIAQKCKEGYYPAKAPIGYKNISLPSNKKIIVPDSNTSHYIKNAFKLYLTGLYSFKTLADKLTDDGFRINGKPIAKHNIENIFDNPIYFGEFNYKGIRYKGQHEPLISRELWNAVQTKRHLAGSPHLTKYNFLYSNLIKCSKCGCYLVGEIKKGKYIYYHCTGNKGGECKRKYIRQEIIDEKIREMLQLIQLSEADIIAIKDSLKELLKEKEDYENSSLDEIIAQIKKFKKRLDQLYLDKIDGLIDDDFYREKRYVWQNQIDDLEVKRNALLKCHHHFIDDVSNMLELCKNAYSLYFSVSDEEKQKMLKLLCSNFFYNGENVHIELKSVFEPIVKNASCNLDLGLTCNIRTFKIAEDLFRQIGSISQIEFFEILNLCA